MLGRCTDVCDIIKSRLGEMDRKSLSKVVGIGASRSETREMDRIAEEVIVESFPEVSILSEEAGFIDRKSDAVLVVDPIDGTKNGIRGLPVYSVSIALAEESLDDTSFGFVENLATGEIYHSEKDKGSYLNGKKIESARDGETMALVSLDSESYAYVEKLRSLGYTDMRSLGCASLEMCSVATGAAGIYFHAKKSLRVIDIAASLLFLREAGGECYEFRFLDRLDKALSLEERFGVVAISGGEEIEDLNSL